MAKDNKSTKSTKSGKSRRTTRTTTEGGLRGNPYGYAVEMAQSYGVLGYDYYELENPNDQKRLGLAAPFIPSNYVEIKKVLTRERDDLPSYKSFRKFSEKAAQVAMASDEGELNSLFTLFLDTTDWNKMYHGCGRKALVVPPRKLPPPQRLIKPDMIIGIDPSRLSTRTWIAKHIPGYVRNRVLISVNGLVEYKSAEGSIPAAVGYLAKLVHNAVMANKQPYSGSRTRLQRHCSVGRGLTTRKLSTQ